MQTRNLVLFFALSLGMLIAWNNYVVPRFFPHKPVQNAANDAAKKDAAALAQAGKTGAAHDKEAAKAAAGKDQPGDKAGDKKPDTSVVKAGDKPAANDAAKDAGKDAAKKGADQAVAKDAAPKGAAAKAGEPAVPKFPQQTIVLGSSDPETGYFLKAELTTKGGSVAGIEFNDPRYRELSNTEVPLKIVGNSLDQRTIKAIKDRDLAQAEHEMAAERLRALQSTLKPGEASAEIDGVRTALEVAAEKLKQADRNVSLATTTFNTDFPEFDALLPKGESGLSARNWKVAQVTADPNHPGVNSAVTFQFPSPDGTLVLEKRYSLESIPGGEGSTRAARGVRDTNTDGYLLHFDVVLTNSGSAERTLSYTLQGPVGLPLEDAANARKFRDLKMGFLLNTGAVNAQTKTIGQIVSDEEKNKVEEWKSPLKYIGVDVQYFAALILPTDDQLKDRTIERSVPMLLETPTEKVQNDLSVQLDSKKVVLAPKTSVKQGFELFAGPKRKTLLTPLQAEGVLDFGWFAQISNLMLLVLNLFHGMGVPYGVAIIFLTILVRACMFPVSLRQTAQAQRMKEMQPKLAEIKKKYADNKEKLAMANLELMREFKVNPMAGCLPLLIQMPIFIALYQALQYSVDLRLAPFLYFKNLAAPDALFKLPFVVPWLGWTTFNLLPIITVALMVVQQKMFMPPPTDEQQEMQQKMMSYMMVVMGAMFYKFPSGLCVYYISSSLWGFGERKLLTWWKPTTTAPPGTDPKRPPDEDVQVAVAGGKQGRQPAAQAAGAVRGAAGSFWQKLLNAADAANSDASKGSKAGISRRRESAGKRNGKRPR
jgi:YidC/Oxa1 family membrane protein insertase